MQYFAGRGIRGRKSFAISSVKTGRTVETTFKCQFNYAFFLVFGKIFQGENILYANAIDKITDIDLDILAEQPTQGRRRIIKVLSNRGQRKRLIVILIYIY